VGSILLAADHHIGVDHIEAGRIAVVRIGVGHIEVAVVHSLAVLCL
jgi:hypothetical protein